MNAFTPLTTVVLASITPPLEASRFISDLFAATFALKVTLLVVALSLLPVPVTLTLILDVSVNPPASCTSFETIAE